MRTALILTLGMVMVMGCSAGAHEDSPAEQTSDANRVGGTVLETIDAASYTYVRFQTADGEAWAAVPQSTLEVGAEVVIVNAQAMPSFESKTLGRTFETIYFGTLEGHESGAPMAGGGGNPHGENPHGAAGGGGTTAGVASGPIEVDKAEGDTGHTVAELYAAKDGLSGKPVSIRGQVVKYNAGIMGRNWIHLQDGTGDAAAGTHDITVTTDETATVGQVVVVNGVVVLDKDFGAGYRYAILVEEATIK